MNSKTVYILGAGCSVKCGYPLAKNFVPAFESFSPSLGGDAEKLKRAVDETVALMREANVQTVDELMFRITTARWTTQSTSPHKPTECDCSAS